MQDNFLLTATEIEQLALHTFANWKQKVCIIKQLDIDMIAKAFKISGDVVAVKRRN